MRLEMLLTHLLGLMIGALYYHVREPEKPLVRVFFVLGAWAFLASYLRFYLYGLHFHLLSSSGLELIQMYYVAWIGIFVAVVAISSLLSPLSAKIIDTRRLDAIAVLVITAFIPELWMILAVLL